MGGAHTGRELGELGEAGEWAGLVLADIPHSTCSQVVLEEQLFPFLSSDSHLGCSHRLCKGGLVLLRVSPPRVCLRAVLYLL